MRPGQAAEFEPNRHHGPEDVNMVHGADDLHHKKLDDESYQMDKEEIEDLFKKLDKNNDGRIDVYELAEGFKAYSWIEVQSRSSAGWYAAILPNINISPY